MTGLFIFTWSDPQILCAGTMLIGLVSAFLYDRTSHNRPDHPSAKVRELSKDNPIPFYEKRLPWAALLLAFLLVVIAILCLGADDPLMSAVLGFLFGFLSLSFFIGIARLCLRSTPK